MRLIPSCKGRVPGASQIGTNTSRLATQPHKNQADEAGKTVAGRWAWESAGRPAELFSVIFTASPGARPCTSSARSACAFGRVIVDISKSPKVHGRHQDFTRQNAAVSAVAASNPS